MTIGSHKKSFAGQTIVDYNPAEGLKDLTAAYCIRIDWAEKGQTWSDKFGQFLTAPQASQITGLVVGAWQEMWESSAEPIIEALAAARDQLPHLTNLFIADVTYEENEISWIQQGDVSPIFTAYPNLRHFGVRGGNGLRFGHINHEKLETLVVETGGLNVSVVHDILSSHLPNLTHLELWLGTDEYGASSTVEDLAPLLTGDLFPKLRYLGLRDSDIADDLAGVLANAPILERLEVLDLSLGTLSDLGARALLNSPAVLKLQQLDLHHHFISDEMMTQLQALPIPVDVREQQDLDDDWRFVAVGE